MGARMAVFRYLEKKRFDGLYCGRRLGFCLCIVRVFLRSVGVRIFFAAALLGIRHRHFLIFSEMAFSSVYVTLLVLSVAFLLINLFAPSANAQAPAPAPTSDGTSIDQGIAYVLMFLALALTYLIHPLDAFPYNLF